MASKKDLVEGQSFSRRRLVTAFVSGAPGGREVEPGKPLRAVVGGVLLSAVLCVGALAVGLLAPTLPDGWDQGSLVIAEDTGARYVALNGTLFPVVNTTSARLLIPSGFKVVSADSDRLTDSPRGQTLGIVGAPDALPAPASLAGDWAACTSRQRGILTAIDATPRADRVTDQAVFASTDDGSGRVTYLVDNGYRYPIAADLVDAVRRNLDLVTAPDFTVAADWINLFPIGTALGSFSPANAGASLAGVNGLPSGAAVGGVVSLEGSPERKFLLLDGGRITQLTPFAAKMYALDPTVAAQPALTVPTLAGGVANAAPVWPDVWPTQVPTEVDGTPCAVLTTAGGGLPAVYLGQNQATVTDNALRATVGAGRGALVRAVGAASSNVGPVFLVDQSGTAYPVTGVGDENPVGRLGYADGDIAPVPLAWLSLLQGGPDLSVTSAGTVVAAASGK